jgi:hypothetical protein
MLFKNVVSIAEIDVERGGNIIINGEVVRIWKETVVYYFPVLSAERVGLA